MEKVIDEIGDTLEEYEQTYPELGFYGKLLNVVAPLLSKGWPLSVIVMIIGGISFLYNIK